MDIAIGALVLVLLLLPGAAALNAYYTSFIIEDRDVKVPLQDLLFQGLLVSLAAHVTAVSVLSLCRKQVDFNLLYHIAIGDKEELNNTVFGPQIKGFLVYSIAVTAICAFLTKIFKTLVIRFHWDQRFPGLKTANFWFSYFSNPVGDLLWADVLTKGNVLYSGFVARFEYSPSKDDIELLVLKQTYRTPFTALLEIEGITEDPKPATQHIIVPQPINGENFLIRGQEIVNINLYPITIEDEPLKEAKKKSEPARRGWSKNLGTKDGI